MEDFGAAILVGVLLAAFLLVSITCIGRAGTELTTEDTNAVVEMCGEGGLDHMSVTGIHEISVECKGGRTFNYQVPFRD